MAKTAIIIDGAGVTATFNSLPIADVVAVDFGGFGGRDEIDLTTINQAAFEVGILGDLVEVEDIVITKKSDPAADMAHSLLNKALVIVFKIGKTTQKTGTYWCQFKGCSPSKLERAKSDDVDLTFGVTNLNASLVETGPVIA